MQKQTNKIKKKIEMLYSFHSVFESITAQKRKFYKVFIKDSCTRSIRGRKLLEISKSFGIKHSFFKNSSIKMLSRHKYTHNFLAIVSPFPSVSFSYILKLTKNIQSSLIVVLDSILDPYNFGAIIRSSYCFGATGIIITKNRTCPPTPTVSKISVGTMEYLPICEVTNLSRTITELKKNGFWIVGTDSKSKCNNITDTSLSSPIAIIFGTEKSGMHNVVNRKCDLIVAIPLIGRVDSLNVSVASGIFLYEISKKIKVFINNSA